tara:strand:+ start:2219 stop:3484 length:1266 start_codon:yes stop_codon:yes gene_type:complete
MKFELNPLTTLLASTPESFDHTVGYHDIRPFNSNNNLVLLHRSPKKNLGFKDKSIKVEICIWDIKNSTIKKIDETDTWSWEQGARLQWVGDNEFVYNKSYKQNPSSIIYNIKTNKTTILDTCIYSYNKNKFLSVNYARLWKLWKSYGYNNLLSLNINIDKKKPDDDGVFLSDLNHNKNLILSINKAVKLCGLDNVDKDFFLCHPTFNPSGNKFISLLRYFNDSGALISYLICTDINSENSIILAREKVSHFEWLNDTDIIVWCRNLSQKIIKLRNNRFLEKKVFPIIKKILNISKTDLKNKILKNDYHLININKPSEAKGLNNKILNEDGHPQISPDKKFLITDTYPNNNGFMKLLLLKIDANKIFEIGKFKIAEYLEKNSLKYDLHPRWDNSGKLINIDSSHLESRQNYIIDISKLLSKI